MEEIDVNAITAIACLISVLYASFILSKNTKNEKQFLLVFMCMILAGLVCLYFIDKLLYTTSELMSSEASKNIFELIKSQMTLIFGYYFGMNNSSNISENK